MMKKGLFVFIICVVSAAAWAGAGADLSKGSRLYKDQKYGQALSAYQDALSKDPSNQDALFNVGAAHYRLQEYKQAQEAWQNASQTAGERQQDALFNLGNAFYRAQDFDAAISAYRKAILQNPQDKEAIHNLQIVLEQKKQNQQNSSNQNDQGDNKQNQNNSGGQDNQKQQQDQEQKNQAKSSQMSPEEAQRVAQMAKENEYRPSYANPGQAEDSGIEKDW